MSDERRGLPSASSAQRYALCPGSFLLEQSITTPEVTSDDASMGNRIHGYLAGDKIALTEDEQMIADQCRRQQIELENSLLPENPQTFVEHRLWHYDDNLEPRWSGKPDRVSWWGIGAVVIDYKTGRGEVEHATNNIQLRALAVLADQHHGPFQKIAVAIIQPLAGEPTVCTYADDDISKAYDEVNDLMELVQTPGQPRNPSTEACKYCKAKEICPEARGVVEHLPALVPRDGLEIVMSPEQIAEFLEKVPLAEAVIEAVRGKARRMLEAKQEIPGWRLKPGAIRETITNPELAFSRFLDAGGTQAQFVAAITVAKTKFKDAVKAATGKKGRDLDGFVEIMLEGCTEAKATAPSLVQDKEVAK